MALINHLFCSAPPVLRSLRSFRRPPGARRGEGPAAPGRRGAGSRDGATSTRDSPGEGSASHLRPTGEFCGNSYKSPLMVNPYKVVPQFVSVQLVNISPISLWFMADINIVFMGFISQLITGGHHPVRPKDWGILWRRFGYNRFMRILQPHISSG